MDKEDLVTLTADIVAAHVGNNNIAFGDLGILIQNVQSTLPRSAPLRKPRNRTRRARPSRSERRSNPIISSAWNAVRARRC